mmetsp:Transcript_21575/g.62012  ORF Transcript_21575/g.62012 Transcript_21575/m.62012 type:complete len:222 (-) Transcript_21575:639-1304(-)
MADVANRHQHPIEPQDSCCRSSCAAQRPQTHQKDDAPMPSSIEHGPRDHAVEADKDDLHRPERPCRAVITVHRRHAEITIRLQQAAQAKGHAHLRVIEKRDPQHLLVVPFLCILVVNLCEHFELVVSLGVDAVLLIGRALGNAPCPEVYLLRLSLAVVEAPLPPELLSERPAASRNGLSSYAGVPPWRHATGALALRRCASEREGPLFLFLQLHAVLIAWL